MANQIQVFFGAVVLACLFTPAPVLSNAKGRQGLEPMSLIFAVETLNRTKPDCYVPGSTKVLQPPLKRGDETESICIVENSLTLTENGGRATTIYSSLSNDEVFGERLIHSQVHVEVNCRAMERRNDYDWYMNRFLLLPKNTVFEDPQGKFSSDGGSEWNYGTYPGPENQWSEWSSIIGSLNVPERFICENWHTSAGKRFRTR